MVWARQQVRVHQIGAAVQSEMGDQLLGLLATVDVQLRQLQPTARMFDFDYRRSVCKKCRLDAFAFGLAYSVAT
jgi:hypothetical protein